MKSEIEKELSQKAQERVRMEADKTKEQLINELAEVRQENSMLEEKYRILIENIQDGVFLIQDGLMKLVNPAFASMVGYKVEEIIGMDFRSLIAPEDVEMVTDRYRRRQAGESVPPQYEFRMLCKDGKSRVDVLMSIGLITFEGKVASLGTVHDITKRKLAENELKLKTDQLVSSKKELETLYAESQNARKSLLSILADVTEKEQSLRESEEKYRAIFDNISEGIYRTTPDGKILLANPALAAMLGYDSAEELLRVNIQLEGYEIPTDRQEFIELIDRNGQVYSFESKWKKKDGTALFIRENARIVRDENGNALYYDGSVEDITERVSQEKERKRLEGQLLQSQKMEAVGQLAGGVAHDFNNLLTIISGYSQLMLDRLDQNTPLRKNVEKIMKAGEQAASLTRQLLAFSRKQVLESKVMDLNTVVTDVEKMLGRLIGEDIKIDIFLAPELEHVKIDKGQIEQVLLNLVINARDAMPDGGKITVRTENVDIDKELSKVIPEALPGRFVRFSVEDAGLGIDKAILDQIFEPFFTTKDVGVGTGLGLSVVYGIIKQHDGWINVYSEPGQGTIFKIYLPAVSAEIDDITKDTISLKELKGSGERILLVEDEEGIRGFAAEALRENGYIIFEAANAKEAHDLFINENGNFDLVFSDVVMPGKSGLELVDELLSGKPDLQVLLCSGYSDKKSQWHEIKKRGFRFLQKPYAVSDLLKIIGEVIQKEVS